MLPLGTVENTVSIRGIMKFTVDRSKWMRGKGDIYSRLLVSEETGLGVSNEYVGKMCCLGFLGLACGVPKEDLENTDFPTTCLNRDKFPDWMKSEERTIGDINDNTGISDVEREERLTKIFAEHGIEVEFL